MGSSASKTSSPSQVRSTQPANKKITIKVHQPNADQIMAHKCEITSNMTEQHHSKDTESDEDFLPRKKSSSDFDDDAFEQFCGEIDSVLVGHSSVIGASQRKSLVSSSVYSGAGRAKGTPPASLRRNNDFPNERRASGTLQGSFPFHQQEHTSHHTHETPPVYSNQGKLSRLQDDQTKHETFSRAAHHGPGLPPPLAQKALNPASNWRLPEELAQREQVLRNRFDDTWYADETAYVGGRNLLQGASRDGSLMKMSRNSALTSSQDGGSRRESKRKEVPSQEREGFEFSKFKAVNKRSNNSKKIDKLLPATYKGYNNHLTRQGTLPSLHGGSLTSDHSSTSTPVRSCSGKQLTYNPSEEDLIAYIEKEFS